MHTTSSFGRHSIHEHVDSRNVPILQSERTNGFGDAREIHAIHSQVNIFR
jgi:hypothetical protein